MVGGRGGEEEEEWRHLSSLDKEVIIPLVSAANGEALRLSNRGHDENFIAKRGDLHMRRGERTRGTSVLAYKDKRMKKNEESQRERERKRKEEVPGISMASLSAKSDSLKSESHFDQSVRGC